MEGLPVEPTDIAAGLMEAHARMNLLEFREGRIDGAVGPGFGQPVDADGDAGAEERSRPLNGR
jgi:hypothetical protein